jgi:plasmid replication initiation protein
MKELRKDRTDDGADASLDLEEDELTPKLIPLPLELLQDGRDELNFAEFPMAVVGMRPPKGVKTLEFTKADIDVETGQPITRKLLITGSDRFGLPTTMDEEVYIALLQLTKMRNFESRTVEFSRFGLLRLIGWSVGGNMYRRLDEALKRLLGITYVFENAWKDRATNTWRTEGFHVLDRVTFDQGEAPGSRDDKKQGRFEFATSKFVWSEVLFRSFKNGNLKKLDVNLYLKLRSRIARRLYRVLDKKMWKRSTLTMDVATLCYEHIGISRKTPLGDLKRKLKEAVDELIQKGYLRIVDAERLFRKRSKGRWDVLFEKAKPYQAPVDQPQLLLSSPEPASASQQIVELMVKCGVSKAKASQLANDHPENRIREKIEVLDWMRNRKDARVSRNPPGFLVASIEKNYPTPHDFTKPRTEKDVVAPVVKENRGSLVKEETALQAAAYWESLNSEENQVAITQALSTANDIEKSVLTKNSETARLLRRSLLERFALAQIAAQECT